MVTYEDSNSTVQTKQFPVHLNVQEAVPAADEGAAEEQAHGGGSAWLWILLAAALIGGGAAYFIWRRKTRAPAQQPADDWDDWDDEEPQETAPADEVTDDDKTE